MYVYSVTVSREDSLKEKIHEMEAPGPRIRGTNLNRVRRTSANVYPYANPSYAGGIHGINLLMREICDKCQFSGLS